MSQVQPLKIDSTSGVIAQMGSDTIAVGNLGTGTPSGANFLRGDGVWAVPPVGGVTDGDKGDISVTSGVWSIDAGAVTYAKIQNVTAQNRLLARTSAGAGPVQELISSNDVFLFLASATNAAAATSLGLGSANAVTFASITLSANPGQKISMQNGTSNWIVWGTAGSGPPTFTSRSIGTKLVLYPGVTSTAVDAAIGVDATNLWFSNPNATDTFKWYNATTLAMSLTGSGGITAASLTLSSASTQKIFLDGGTGSYIVWGTIGYAPPSTTTRSLGTKLVLFPNTTATDTDYSIGIEGGNMWFCTPGPGTAGYKWYANTTAIMFLREVGLGIGISPVHRLDVRGSPASGTWPAAIANTQAVIGDTSGFANTGLALLSASGNDARITFGHPTATVRGAIKYSNASDNIVISVGAGTCVTLTNTTATFTGTIDVPFNTFYTTSGYGLIRSSAANGDVRINNGNGIMSLLLCGSSGTNPGANYYDANAHIYRSFNGGATTYAVIDPYGVTSYAGLTAFGAAVTTNAIGQVCSMQLRNSANSTIYSYRNHSGNIGMFEYYSGSAWVEQARFVGSSYFQIHIPVYTYSVWDRFGNVRDIPQNLKNADYVTVADDAGKHIYHSAADPTTARAYGIESNATIPYAIGTAITFINQIGASAIYIYSTDTLRLAGSGATGTKLLAPGGIATAIKVAATEWVLSGTGIT